MAIDEKDIERMKEIFVTRKECTENTEGQNRKFANDDKRLAIIETYNRIQIWIMSAIGAGVLGILVKLFTGGNV